MRSRTLGPAVLLAALALPTACRPPPPDAAATSAPTSATAPDRLSATATKLLDTAPASPTEASVAPSATTDPAVVATADAMRTEIASTPGLQEFVVYMLRMTRGIPLAFLEPWADEAIAALDELHDAALQASKQPEVVDRPEWRARVESELARLERSWAEAACRVRQEREEPARPAIDAIGEVSDDVVAHADAFASDSQALGERYADAVATGNVPQLLAVGQDAEALANRMDGYRAQLESDEVRNSQLLRELEPASMGDWPETDVYYSRCNVTPAPTPTPTTTPTITPTPAPNADPVPAGEHVETGESFRYHLDTRCGVRFARFDGRTWELEDPERYQEGYPQPAWATPFERGIMYLVGQDIAIFRRDDGHEIRFRPTEAEPEPCSPEP